MSTTHNIQQGNQLDDDGKPMPCEKLVSKSRPEELYKVCTGACIRGC